MTVMAMGTVFGPARVQPVLADRRSGHRPVPGSTPPSRSAAPRRMLIRVSAGFSVADEMLRIKFNAKTVNQVELGFEIVNVPFLVLH